MAVLSILLSTLSLFAPLALAALGGLVSERSGIINLALEGKMLTAACVAALASIAWSNAYLGLASGVGAAVVLSLLHWLLTQKFAIDHIVSGMAINLLALGGTNFLVDALDKGQNSSFPILPTVLLDLGSAGKFNVSIYMVLALILPFLVHAYLKNTRAGLRLIAVGSDPEKARLLGVRPLRVRFVAAIATGVFTGLAGVMLVSNVARFTNEMTAGKGYIALAALILGGWRPIQALAACLAFALFDAIQIQLQGTDLLGAKIPSEAWQALPYVVTVIALAGFLSKSRAPQGLGKA